MPFLSKAIFSQFDQPLVNSPKPKKPNAAEVKSSQPIQGIANTRIAQVGAKTAEAASGENVTRSRAHFAEAFPSMFKKQEYHMKQLRAGIPVHRSGKLDSVLLPVVYVSGGLLFGYCMYVYVQIIKSS